MKIVSLLPSATEIVYALGLQDALEGVTFECDHPPGASSKRVVSRAALELPDDPSGIDAAVDASMAAREPLYTLDDAAIRDIQPDVILAQDLCRVCAIPSGQVTDALEAIGCRAEVVSLDPHDLEDIISGIETVGAVAGVPQRAAAVADGLRVRVDAVREKTALLQRQATLALEWPDPPFVAGHWVPEMIHIAGGEDVLGDAGQPSVKVTWERIAEAAPELIVSMPCGFHLDRAVSLTRELLDVEELRWTPAAGTGNVFAVDGSSFFSRPGPRVIDGLETLAWILHPDAFPEPAPGRVARVGN